MISAPAAVHNMTSVSPVAQNEAQYWFTPHMVELIIGCHIRVILIVI